MMYKRAAAREWKEETLPPFDELMITWNGSRPAAGKLLFYISLQFDKWSPWLLYATWERDRQASCHSTTNEAPVRVYQDTVEVMESSKAIGFQIKIEGPIESIHTLHVYTNSDQRENPEQAIDYSVPVFLPLKGISQILLKHSRHRDLCSPTSTTAVVRYLSNSEPIHPLYFADKSWDSHFDIYGNWVFNVVQAATELGPKWDCWVERLKGFNDIYRRLRLGTPVVVSIRGPLAGSAGPYPQGHLIAVIGYDPEEKKVICMDPAFPTDEKTLVRYDFSDFLQAWNRRGRAAYIFSKSAKVST
jgi:hypothetical protein